MKVIKLTTLIVTDAHYGSPVHPSAPSIYNLLDKIEEEYHIKKIISCGDMFELIYNTKEKVFSRFRNEVEILSDSSTIFVVGNHDMCLIDEFENSCYSFTKKGMKYIHGYQFEFIGKSYSELKKFEKFCYKLSRSENKFSKLIVGGIKFKIQFPYIKGHANSFLKKEEIVEIVSRRYPNSVFGHFHTQIFEQEAFCLNALCNGFCYVLKKNEIIPIPTKNI